jgi:hypothetical protein
VRGSDGVGSGLPYELVATEPGISPGQAAGIVQDHPFGRTVGSRDSGRNFDDQLRVDGASGAVTFVVTSTNAHLEVMSSGAIRSIGGPLRAGDYAVAGTDSDSAGDVGTWRYTLVVQGFAHDDGDGDRD